MTNEAAPNPEEGCPTFPGFPVARHLDRTACAAFFAESRMQLDNATNLDRKSGAPVRTLETVNKPASGVDFDAPAVLVDHTQQPGPVFHDGQELRGIGRPSLLSHAEEVGANLSELRVSSPEPALT
jgi:hypothetical protein